MGVVLLESPTTPNVTGTNLIYSLSSSIEYSPQFRYVTDIYNYPAGDQIVRIKTYANSYSTSNVDVSRELNDQLDYDNFWKVNVATQAVETVKVFDLRFGEEYSDSISGSRTVYPGSSNNYLQVFPGIVFKNQGSAAGGFNYDYSAHTVLSNMPTTQSIESGSYHTVAIYDENAIVTYKLNDGTTLGSVSYTNNSTNFMTIPIGSANLNNYGNFDYIELTTGGLSYRWDAYENCEDEYTRFAFINQYGFWDYYSIHMPLRKNSSVNRSLYDQEFVKYEKTIAYYNVSNRGTTQYLTEYQDTFEITTDQIGKYTADWLTELFESPNVFIQKDGNFIPVNILDTNVVWNMNPYRQKLFQYSIRFKYANQRESR